MVMIDFEALTEKVKREREWLNTPLGAAFFKFESAHSRYWQNDANTRISDKRLFELDKAMQDARAEFLKLLRGW